MDGGDFAVAPDDESGGQSFDTSVLLADFFIAEDDRIFHVLLFEPGCDDLPAIVVHGDTENSEAAGLPFLLKFDEPGGLDFAGSAPSGPEVDEDDFTLKFREANGGTSGGFEFEVRGKVTNHCGAVSRNRRGCLMHRPRNAEPAGDSERSEQKPGEGTTKAHPFILTPERVYTAGRRSERAYERKSA